MFKIYHMLIFILVPNMKKTCAAICGGILKLETDNVDLPKFFLIIPLVSF